MRTYILLSPIFLTALCAFPDSIVIDGMAYEDVYIRETENMYYVSVPAEGKTIAARKAKVGPEDVVIAEDEAARARLLAVYKENAAALRRATGAADEDDGEARAGPFIWVEELQRDGLLNASRTFDERGPVSIKAVGTAKPNAALLAAHLQWNIAEQKRLRQLEEQWARERADARQREAAALQQAVLLEIALRAARAREYEAAAWHARSWSYAPYRYGVTTIYSPFGLQTTHILWPAHGNWRALRRGLAPRTREPGAEDEARPDDSSAEGPERSLERVIAAV